MRVFVSVFLALAFFSIAACQTTIQQVPQKQARKVTDQKRVKPIALSKIVVKMRRGQDIGTLHAGLACLPYDRLYWASGSRVDFASDDLIDVFREELERNGWPVVGSTDNLFTGNDLSGAELLVAGKIASIEANVCFPFAKFGNSRSKGSLRLAVEWQVYDPVREEVIRRIKTQGSANQQSLIASGADVMLRNAFAVAANNLLASRQFAAVTRRQSATLAGPAPTRKITLKNRHTRHVTEQNAILAARQSTVTVRVGRSHGSGFAIGDGHHVITNAHVVGNAKQVTLLLAGGIETPGRVLRKDKGRDVALIKVDAVRLPPIHVDTALPTISDAVYAIGAPNEIAYSGTVTRGIVSSLRQLNGYSWIQADVTINGGNSGGPLVNTEGSVIGISTAADVGPSGTAVGVNIFVPIGDALKYLGLNLPSRTAANSS